MSESDSDRSVIVTAEERTHPALRKLAQACLALAEHLRDEAAVTTNTEPLGSDQEAAR
jgi:hypothetical protein